MKPLIAFRSIEIKELPQKKTAPKPRRTPKASDHRQLTGQVDSTRSIAEINKQKGEDFLAANKTKEGVKMRPSGLQYVILKEGAGSGRPRPPR